MRNEPSYEVPVCGRCGCAGDLDRTLRLCLPCITAETQEQTIRQFDHAVLTGCNILDDGTLQASHTAYRRQILEAARGHVPIGSIAKNPRPR